MVVRVNNIELRDDNIYHWMKNPFYGRESEYVWKDGFACLGDNVVASKEWFKDDEYSELIAIGDNVILENLIKLDEKDFIALKYVVEHKNKFA